MKRWLLALTATAMMLCVATTQSMARPPVAVGVGPGGVTVAYGYPRFRPFGYGYYAPGYYYSPYPYGAISVPTINSYGYYGYPYQPYVYYPNVYNYGGGPYIYGYAPRPYIYYY